MPEVAWEQIIKQHKKKMSRLFQSLKIDISVPENKMPTDKRLFAYQKGNQDPALPLLYFNYGRYLLIASSVNADLPANLQGKWNEDLNPPWDLIIILILI